MKLSTVGVHSCVVPVLLMVAMATIAKNKSKTEKKMLIFVIFVIFKCDLSPINISKGISLFIKNFLALFLINSWQFYMIKIFWV